MAEKWSTQPLYLGASGTVKVWFRYQSLFAGSRSSSAALLVIPRGTNAHQTEMFQSTTFTCLEMWFWMKIRLSVSIKRNSLTEMNLPVQEIAENFYTNLPTKTNPDTGKGCSLQDPSSQAAAEFWLPSVTCIKSQWVAPQARSLSYCETCVSPSPHPFPALKP